MRAQLVCPWRIRYQFNAMGFDDRVSSGELMISVISRRAGELGGSGRPDPKWLLVRDEEWNIAHSDDEEPCEDCAIWRPHVLGLH